jgi:hypothetical protein
VSVLFVRVSVPAKVESVPVVGNVSAVVPETVRVVPKAPEIVRVLAALLATPVPPCAGPNPVVKFISALGSVMVLLADNVVGVNVIP